MRWLALAAAAAVAAAASFGREPPPAPPAFASAIRCGGCHEFQYGTWRRGPHADAATSETFRAAYVLAGRDLGEERAAETCLACHAPAALAAGDLRLEEAIGREGVTCDVCHSIVGVGRLGAPAPFDLDVGRVKRGPYGDGEPVDHDVSKSDVVGSSQACGGCHQADLAPAFVAYGTYGEWNGSRWSRTRCVECHMPAREGQIAAGGPWRPARRDHAFEASSPEWWARGLRLEVEIVRGHPADRLVVRITNAAGGHAAPTGHPDRRLEVRAVARDADGRKVVDGAQILGLILADTAGNAPVPFWRAATQAVDSRLRPDETREFVWTLPRDRAARAEATVSLWAVDPRIQREYRIAVDPVEVLRAEWGADRAVGLRDLL